jgi:hypothetical protein
MPHVTMSRMVFALITITFFAEMAGPPRAAAKEPTQADFRTQVEEALTRASRPVFSGMVSFQLEVEVSDGPGPDAPLKTHNVQSHTIVTDGRGGIYVEALIPDGERPLISVESPLGRWGVFQRRLFVVKTDIPQGEEGARQILRNLVAGGQRDMDWLFGQTIPTPLRVLSANEETLTAGVRGGDGRTRHIIFQRHEGKLLLQSLSYEDDQAFYQMTYSGWRPVGDYWVTEGVKFRQDWHNGYWDRWQYSTVVVQPMPDGPELGEKFRVPDNRYALPVVGDISAVTTFRDDGTQTKSFDTPLKR